MFTRSNDGDHPARAVDSTQVKTAIEGLACIAWFVGILGSSTVRHNVLSDLSRLPCNCIRAIARGKPEFWIEADVL